MRCYTCRIDPSVVGSLNLFMLQHFHYITKMRCYTCRIDPSVVGSLYLFMLQHRITVSEQLETNIEISSLIHHKLRTQTPIFYVNLMYNRKSTLYDLYFLMSMIPGGVHGDNLHEVSR
ncbi:hypothetical protein Y032_0190g1252 [Ancylostoma ceylanicum]|uniref:Uncharacterized protein n=1 Tax=Ancylostoma ceylanicum TaxID=53326 RepID=A0A016SQ79_9BILA|nr:hypothetical protein Y032_0190g1252 [Ancylostoma ceylanicum]